MLKDTFFSPTRFICLCRKEMVENWKANLLRVVVLYGVMAIILVWNGYFQYDNYQQSYFFELYTKKGVDPAWGFTSFAFLWFLWGFGCLAASFSFENMKRKTTRLSTLMVPATNFEKYFSRWAIYTVVYLVVFLIAFKLADYTRVWIYSLSYPKVDVISSYKLSSLVGENISESSASRYLFENPFALWAALAFYLFTQSVFILGSTVWPKNAFLKTFAAVAVIVIIYILTGVGIAKSLYEPGVSYPPLLDKDHTLMLIAWASTILAIFNWVLGYFRFKESEIIHRL